MHFNNLTEVGKFQCMSQTSELCLIQDGGLIVTVISSTENDSLEASKRISLIHSRSNN